jgi:excisionase family DNA binding protein
MPLLTRREAAKFLAISERKFASLVAAGRIPRVRIDRSTRYRPQDLDRFSESNLQFATKQEVPA